MHTLPICNLQFPCTPATRVLPRYCGANKETIMTSPYSKYHELAMLVTLVSINLIMWVLLVSSLVAWFGADPAI